MSARSALASAVGAYLRTYHRHEVVLDKPIPEPPALVIGNHGFGGILDLNVLALRLKALPISVSVPWGPNVGLVGMLPWAPLPTKLRTAVLAPMSPEPDESVDAFAARVEAAMQTRLDELVADRVPVLG